MIVPLQVNVDMAKRLKKKLKSFPFETRLVENIIISSQLVLLHSRDFLDKQLIERGVFVPMFLEGSLLSAAEEAISLVQMTK